MNLELGDYVKKALQGGMSKEECRKNLLEAGWAVDLVDSVMASVEMPRNTIPKGVYVSRKIKAAVLVVCSLVFIGVLSYILFGETGKKETYLYHEIYLPGNEELSRINFAFANAKDWQSDAQLYGLVIYQLSRAEEPYVIFNFFSKSIDSCYYLKLEKGLYVAEKKEISCNDGIKVSGLEVEGLKIGSAEVIPTLNAYARYSKLSELNNDSFVNIGLERDESTGGLVWLALMQMPSESLSPTVMVDANTGELLKTFVTKESADGQRKLDHYD